MIHRILCKSIKLASNITSTEVTNIWHIEYKKGFHNLRNCIVAQLKIHSDF